MKPFNFGFKKMACHVRTTMRDDGRACEYKSIIVFSACLGIVIWSLLLWTETLAALQAATSGPQLMPLWQADAKTVSIMYGSTAGNSKSTLISVEADTSNGMRSQSAFHVGLNGTNSSGFCQEVH
uniref:Uncharacterized protein n=1 Tax=Anopheles culicifacies TaxID=139723 RepID=A0A182LV09_9DIPT